MVAARADNTGKRGSAGPLLAPEQLRRKKQVLCEDVFKMRSHKTGRKDGGTENHAWTMTNLCPSLPCLSQQATSIRGYSWWPIGLLAWCQADVRALWSSCTNRSLWNGAGPSPVRPRPTDQPPHGATMAVACHACPAGRQMEQGSCAAYNLWAQQFCLVTEWLCIGVFWKYIITE